MKNPLATWKQLNPEAKRLGYISFFGDLASEMLYPITPIFLTTVVGAPPQVLGLIEGVADATSACLQWFSGRLSDRWKKRKPLIVLGYFFSALSRPLIGLSTHWGHVLLARASDRFGKGLRSSPRDAMLGDLSTVETRGLTFGWHRSMDTMGAVLGPLIALSLLPYFSDRLRWLYLFALIPGLLAVLIAKSVREPTVAIPSHKKPLTWLPWRSWSPEFRYFILSWSFFSIGNCTDFFLLLKLKNSGASLPQTILIYCFFNLTYSLLSPFLGDLSDRMGRKKILVTGLFIFSFVYAGFSVAVELWHFIILYAFYGAYNAATEGLAKAYTVDLIPTNLSASGLGLFGALTGFSALIGGLLAGLMWTYFGSGGPMLLGAFTAFSAALLLIGSKNPKPRLNS